MFQKIKTKAVAILNRIHLFVFNMEMGERTKSFVKNISYMGLGNIGFTAFMFVVNIVAVRFLGPEEYGKYALVISVANFFIIPMTLGITSSLTKYLPEHLMERNVQSNIISSSFLIIVACTILTSITLLIFRDSLSVLLGVPVLLFFFAVLYSASTVFKNIAESILKGFHRFKEQAVLEVVYAMIIFVVFFSLFFLTHRTFKIYVEAIVVGLVSYFIIIYWRNKNYFRFLKFDKKWSTVLLEYGLWGVGGSLSWAAITNSDRFFLNKLVNVEAVGIYVVYYGASMIFISRFLSIVINVFFPTSAGIKDKAVVNNKLNKLFKIAALPAFFMNCLVIYLMLLIYGPDYPINLSLIFLFSFSSILFAFMNVKWNLIASIGVVGVSFCSRYSFYGAILSVICNLLLINYLGIYGAVIATIITSFYFLVVASSFKYRD